MRDKQENTKAKKADATKKDDLDKLLKEHPYETMSQIQNRYGKGREKQGSDGTFQDTRGSNH